MKWTSQKGEEDPAILQALRLAGWTAVRVKAPGVMDLLCVRDGVVRVLGVKSPKEKHRRTAAQQELRARLRSAGLEVPEVRTPEEALRAVGASPLLPERARPDARSPIRGRHRRAISRQSHPGQLAFGFLPGLPVAARRVRHASRPRREVHTRAVGEQLVLTLRSPARGRRYLGVEAIAMEDALRAARTGKPGAVERLLELTRVEVAEVARAMWRPGCSLAREDLEHEGELELLRLKAWERFTPGESRGRTLWPAYARKLARQAMGRALEATTPIHVTRWGRRRRKAAQARASAEKKTLEAVLSEGSTAHGGAHLLAEEGLRTVPLKEAAHLHDDLELMQFKRAEEAQAVTALAALPVRLRAAVAGPLGFLREGVVGDRALARHLGTTLESVRQLREEGLRQLREALREA